MNSTILRRALRFGDGTRLDRSRRGIGRFGVGLPQSSISQCQRVDIWTWQNGADNAFHCYLDLDEIKSHGRQEVPEPVPCGVPDRWRKVVDNVLEPGEPWSYGANSTEFVGEEERRPWNELRSFAVAYTESF